jgi:hypothetical protein
MPDASRSAAPRLADVAREWILTADHLCDLEDVLKAATAKERRTAFLEAADEADRRLTASRARSDQREAELRDLRARQVELRQLLGLDDAQE